MVYMELAEMGFGVAALNLALILERQNVLETDRMLLGELGASKLSPDFNINR